MLDTLIVNCSLVIPNIGIVRKNIGIKDGMITLITQDKVSANKIIDAKERYIIPGVIDPHVHYGVFEPIDEAAVHESRSAATGGVTCMMRMFRLYGSYKDKLKKHLEAGNKHIIDYAYHASILLKEQIEEIEYCTTQGIRSFKLYMNLKGSIGKIYMDMEPYQNKLIEGHVNIDENFIKDTINEVAKHNSMVIIHAEDPDICMKEMNRLKDIGRNDLHTWSEARPQASEKKAIKFITNVARDKCAVYIPHIGSKEGLEEALNAKRYMQLYIETCPHYLTHTVDFNNIKGKVVPPLRSKDDQATLWTALSNDKIDCIGSDHVANKLDDKVADNSIWNALAGFPGIATLLPVMLSEGINKGRISLEQLVRVTSYNAARIFGLTKKGNIQIGYDADLTIIDLKKEMKVTPEILNSYSDYTIYDGMILTGWSVLTMVRGEIVMQDNIIIGKEGYGKYIRL